MDNRTQQFVWVLESILEMHRACIYTKSELLWNRSAVHTLSALTALYILLEVEKGTKVTGEQISPKKTRCLHDKARKIFSTINVEQAAEYIRDLGFANKTQPKSFEYDQKGICLLTYKSYGLAKSTLVQGKPALKPTQLSLEYIRYRLVRLCKREPEVNKPVTTTSAEVVENKKGGKTLNIKIKISLEI